MISQPFCGAIEAGGTKFLCTVGKSPAEMEPAFRIPTTTPRDTLQAVVRYFKEKEAQHGKLASLGVGTFGPAGVTPGAADFGFITTTPKPGWHGTDVIGTLRQHFAVPFGFDTDVNAAALGELEPGGAGVGSRCLLYLTVGTGIGGGCVIDGKPLHGLIHPEMGHIRVPRHPSDLLAGCCPWHGDCLEGLASGEAMFQRWGQRAETLPEGHEAWDLEAYYLATAAVNFLLTLSSDRMIFGGSVSGAPGLLAKIHTKAKQLLAGYLAHPAAVTELHTLMVLPGQKQPPGLVGAMRLALNALKSPRVF